MFRLCAGRRKLNKVLTPGLETALAIRRAQVLLRRPHGLPKRGAMGHSIARFAKAYDIKACFGAAFTPKG